MNHERLMKQGLLADLRQQAEQLNSQCENHHSALRNASFVVHTYAHLDAGRINEAAASLSVAIRQMQAVNSRIARIQEDLGV